MGTVVNIADENDVVEARQRGRELAAEQGLNKSDCTLVATAISEIARNIIKYAGSGEIVLEAVTRDDQSGVRVTGRDDGPGIENVERALQDGFTTGDGLGLGLPGARRLMDEFEIQSSPGEGTKIVMSKWKVVS